MTATLHSEQTVQVSDAEPAPVPESGEKLSDKSNNWTVVLSSTAVFLIALELTVISVALPRIEATFSESSRATLSWVFTSYNVGVAALLLMGGWLAERFGRKLIFQIGLAVFAAGSIVSGIAPAVAILIAGRVVQAVGGALLLPSSLALILHTVAPSKRDAAIGIWGATAGLAAAVGPTAGALLVQYAGWRWVFLLNVPIALAAIVRGQVVLTETRDPSAPRRVDLLAAPLGAGGTALLVFAIVAAGPLGLFDTKVLLAFVASLALLVGFIYRTRTHAHPVFPVDLAQTASYRIGIIGTGIFGAAFTGWLVLAPTFLVEVWDYSVLQAGFAIAPAPLAMAVTAGPAGKLAARIGYRRLITIGALLPVAGVVWWIATITSSTAYVTGFLPGAVLLGIGVGVGFPMLTAASMRDVAPGRFAMGAAGNTTLRQVAMALGISAAVAIVGGDEAAVRSFQLSWLLCGALFAVTSVLVLFAYPDSPPALETVPPTTASPTTASPTTASPTTAPLERDPS